jgi:glycerophosphoryl diester phosphodiesterase
MAVFSLFTHLPKPTIFAHRGASAYAPENTLAAFELAVLQGADAIELDAKLTADGEVVVIHDQTVNRTTGAKGRVAELTLAELRQLDAGSHFDIAFHGEPIPTLDEVFEAVGRKLYINVELTNYASVTDLLAEKAADLVRKHHLENRVLFSSFNPLALWRAKRRLPRVPGGLLTEQGRKGALARSPLGYLLGYAALHPHLSDLTPGLVERMHQRGCRVHVWTVNRSDDMQRLFSWGVDGIFTDDPVLARQVLANADLSRAGQV